VGCGEEQATATAAAASITRVIVMGAKRKEIET
jgi:hypothetical protein